MRLSRNNGQTNGTCRERKMNKGSVLSVKGNRAGQTIRCLNGKVWITQTGDNHDRFLNEGELYLSNLSSNIVISALDDAMIKVCPERKERSIGWSRQIWQGGMSTT